MDYRVRLDSFEGPLDLLLHLIEKNEVDIYDIPIAVITEQYFDYLSAAEEVNLDNLAEFLVMAATLISIKTRMLFPRPDAVPPDGGEEEDDPREELVQRLLLYRKFKEVASYLASRQEGEEPRVYYREDDGRQEDTSPAEVRASLPELFRAFQAIWAEKRAKPASYVVTQADVDVGEKMKDLLYRLRQHPRGMVFQDLFTTAGSRREALVLFLALLELVRQRQVRATQDTSFGRIRVQLLD
ncbi:MAG: segregation/condensation protein A [Syntrophomonadaceae bacterium]|nr:segregation/condensation protein A [Syntrophomonadaceae bacterium]